MQLDCHKIRRLSDYLCSYLTVFVLSILLLLPLSSMSDILHLELGAANYSASYSNSSKIFSVLEKTLQNMTEKYGNKGTIFINDIDSEGLKLAVVFAESWVAERGYSIKIVPIPGDYTQIDLPHVKTLHLTNPTWNQLPNQKYPEERKATAESLEKIAALSETGLIITTYFQKEMEYLDKVISPASTLKNTRKNGYHYYFPGRVAFGLGTKVFILKSKGVSCKAVFKKLE